MAVTVEELAGALAACLEGVRYVAYKDPGGVWTCGIGHTGPDVKEGTTCTYQQALAWLAADDKALFDLVTGRPVLAGAALLDFGLNCGRGALLRVLHGQDTIDNPVHTTDRRGVVQPGLVARRRLEVLLIQLSGELSAAR